MENGPSDQLLVNPSLLMGEIPMKSTAPSWTEDALKVKLKS